jgi:hypothetical protein
MKKIIFAILLVAGASKGSFAQSSNNTTSSQSVGQGSSQATIQQKAHAETDKWATMLNLTTQQKVQIQEVNVQVETQKDHIAQSGTAASPLRTTALMDYKNSRYQVILTAAQYATYQANQ